MRDCWISTVNSEVNRATPHAETQRVIFTGDRFFTTGDKKEKRKLDSDDCNSFVLL